MILLHNMILQVYIYNMHIRGKYCRCSSTTVVLIVYVSCVGICDYVCMHNGSRTTNGVLGVDRHLSVPRLNTFVSVSRWAGDGSK